MENKTSRYFKYAIGEILLVVIGILIALQINNWNDLQKLKEQEVNYYCKIQEDLNADILNIEKTIVSLKNRQDATTRVLTNLLKVQEDKEVLFKDYLPAIRSQDFVPTKAAIEDITSSGKLENLRNQDIKNAILNYYVEQDYALTVIEANDMQISEKVFSYMDYTDFGIQELPLYNDIYSDELKGLLKSTDWQKDPDSKLFRYFKDHMNMTLIICEREQDLLMQIRNASQSVIELLEPYCSKG